MNVSVLASERIELKWRKRPFAILEIKNRLTRNVICASPVQTILIRNPLELFEPVILTKIRNVSAIQDGFSFTASDRSESYAAIVKVTSTEDGIRFALKATAPEPLWMVEWQLGGFLLRQVIVPALGGQSLDQSTPAGTVLSYKYPFWWNAQFVIGTLQQGGCWIRMKDSAPELKLLRVRREQSTFQFSLGFEANAPLRSRTHESEWFIDCYEGMWKTPVDSHRRWMEQSFGVQRRSANERYPAWMRRVNFVLELWGITKDRALPLHTFDQMIWRLHEWKKLHTPEQTLVYLPGFAEHGVDSHAPDYNPSDDLGGDKGFKKLVRAAHAMGFKVMVHTNVLAMTYRHRMYNQFKNHQVVDAFGRKQGWGLDMDGDWLAEPYFAYINPGSKKWGDLMVKVVGKLINEYGVDAVFLDQTLLAFNVSKGPNFLTGMRNHIRRLQEAYPDTLFAGEGLHEHVVGELSVAQIHGIDSIAEVHGADGRHQWRKAHPVSTYLFSPYTKFVAHLLTKHPSDPMFGMQERAYKALGVVPALCLYDHSQKMDMPEVRQMILRAGRLTDEHSDVILQENS
ncbi:MAG TPA: DUF6259 domain-containing protein [Bacteroidota bacterium]